MSKSSEPIICIQQPETLDQSTSQSVPKRVPPPERW